MTNDERREFKRKYEAKPYVPPPIKRRSIIKTSFTRSPESFEPFPLSPPKRRQ